MSSNELQMLCQAFKLLQQEFWQSLQKDATHAESNALQVVEKRG